jgi:HAD superfamily hydrolase (TIGR01509 family)
MIRAVLFDLFETLITESRFPPTRASGLGEALGLEGDAFRVEWKARRPLVMVGQLSFGEALTEISMALAGSVNAVAVQRVCDQRVREKAIAFAEIDQGIAAMITELRGRDLSVGVISNCFAEDVRAWSTWPLSRQCQCSVFSYAARVAKPDPAIYLNAVRELGVEPTTTVFIGDDGDRELVGAEQAGLRAFRAEWFGRRGSDAGAASDNAPGFATPQDVLTLVDAANPAMEPLARLRLNAPRLIATRGAA